MGLIKFWTGIWEEKGGREHGVHRQERNLNELGNEDFEWARFVTSTMYVEVWQVHAVQPGPCAGATWDPGDHRVLSRSLEMQVWQQAVYAMIFICLICCGCNEKYSCQLASLMKTTNENRDI